LRAAKGDLSLLRRRAEEQRSSAWPP